ncbi:hypothetical protein IP88_10140 [alpha proteobacterium AAP81b]|nr:hypothetical protein IP88_10140 [alpha proteobacterium AAP81b]
MRLLVVALAMLLAAPALAACPNAGLATETVTFVTATGRHPYKVEIAATPDEQTCGMMFRESAPPGTGMVFPFAPPRDAAFWMKNTQVALDIIFVGPDDRVVSIGDGKPFSRDLVPSGGITANVVELARGEGARIGLKPGDRVLGLRRK